MHIHIYIYIYIYIYLYDIIKHVVPVAQLIFLFSHMCCRTWATQTMGARPHVLRPFPSAPRGSSSPPPPMLARPARRHRTPSATRRKQLRRSMSRGTCSPNRRKASGRRMSVRQLRQSPWMHHAGQTLRRQSPWEVALDIRTYELFCLRYIYIYRIYLFIYIYIYIRSMYIYRYKYKYIYIYTPFFRRNFCVHINLLAYIYIYTRKYRRKVHVGLTLCMHVYIYIYVCIPGAWRQNIKISCFLKCLNRI